MYGLRLVSPPAAEPVSLIEAKAWLKVEHTADDTLISGLISAARILAERMFGCQFVTATWQLTLEGFPEGGERIELPRGPLQSVTSIQYVDTDGEDQTLDASEYEVDETRDPGFVQPVDAGYWPQARYWQVKTVQVTYQSGYGAAAAVPEPIKAALKFAVASWYTRRGDGDTEVDLAKLALPAVSQMMLMDYWSGNYA